MEEYERMWNDLKDTFKHNMPTEGYIWVGSVIGIINPVSSKKESD